MKIHVLTLIIATSVSQVFSQTLDTLWSRHIALPGYEINPSIAKGANGTFWVCGETSSFGGDGDFLLMKYTSDGDSVYSRVLGGPENEAFRDMLECPDGGAVVVGGTGSFGPFPRVQWSQWIERISADGDSLWSVTVGEYYHTLAVSVARATDDSYVVIGDYAPYWDTFQGGFLVTRISGDGVVTWSVSFPNADSDSAWFARRVSHVQVSPDGDILITGRYIGYDMPDPNQYYAFWMRLSSEGELLDFVCLPNQISWPAPFLVLPNGNSVVAYRCTLDSVCVVCLTTTGEILWTTQLALPYEYGVGWVNEIILGDTGAIVIAAKNGYNFHIFGITLSGESLYSEFLEFPNSAWGADIIHASNDSFAAGLYP